MNIPAPNDPELDALLGAYALDALDPGERARVDAYVATNVQARDEVDELRESAAALALAPVDDTTAPPELWDRISRTIERELAAESGGEDEDVEDELAARRGRRSPRWMTIVAAAAAMIAIALTVQVVSLHHRLDNAGGGTGERAAAAAFVRAGQVAGARKVALAPANGAEVARVVLLPDGSGYLKSDGLAQLDAQHTYQLWALTGSAAHPVAISAGVLGSHPQAAEFRTSDPVLGFALTVEPAPGAPQPSQAPFASALLS